MAEDGDDPLLFRGQERAGTKSQVRVTTLTTAVRDTRLHACCSAATSSEVLRDVNQVLRVAWYRFRATFGSRWGGYLTVVLLVGLLGGLAMGSVAGARRTDSSFPIYLASTNPSSIMVLIRV